MLNQNINSKDEEFETLEEVLADFYASFSDGAFELVLKDFETNFEKYIGESDISLYETREKELLKSIRNLKKLTDFYSSEIEA